MHPNARLIETLYSSLRDNQPDAAAACYADDAHFEDIAFRLDSRERILQMWRLVCSRKVGVTFDSVVADDRKGGANWVARYTIADTRTEGHQRHHLPLRVSRRLDRQPRATGATPWPGPPKRSPSLSTLPSARSSRSGSSWPATSSKQFIEDDRSRDAATTRTMTLGGPKSPQDYSEPGASLAPGRGQCAACGLRRSAD